MKSKIETAIWFARRPSFWPHAVALVARKFAPDRDAPPLRAQATDWARQRAVPVAQALAEVGLLDAATPAPLLSPSVLRAAERKAELSPYEMGGPGDLDLLYGSCVLANAQAAIETGVAYGWSSLAILAAMQITGGSLASVDMPYVKAGNEPWVGIVVPDDFRSRWTLIRQPDRNGLRRALRMFPDGIDFAHYDSDKSYAGRMFAYPLIWQALRPGGLFLSDDIQDNFAFRDFVTRHKAHFAVTAAGGKFAAIVRKG